MRNLNLWNIAVKPININTHEKFKVCYGHQEDSTSLELYICFSNLDVTCYNDSKEIKWTKNLLEFVPADKTFNEPVNITYLSLTNTINVGLTNGELFTINNAGTVCDLVGVCENGLLAMKWSPDQEILILVTTNLKVIVMSCTFDPISESSLLNKDFGEKQFITVGWGKKETQFHGSEGKQAATAKVIITEDGNDSNCNVKISWRGDGELFAVGFSMDGIRRFKIFDRDGNLQYTSEKHQGLEANLSWRPSGNLIATTQKLQQKYLVAFFEKNGLKHGEFTIPVNSGAVVEDILWSLDSEILTLLCKDPEKNVQELLLFTSSNYHWYLKQTLKFRSDQLVSKVLWDNDFDTAHNKIMHVLLQNGQCYTYSWIWNVDHSTGKLSGDDAVVSVIDGKKALITSFRNSLVPPPMSNIEIEFADFIHSIHFSAEETNSNTFMVCISNKLVIMKQTQKNPIQYAIENEYSLDNFNFPLQFYNWHLINNKIIVCVTVHNDNCYSINQFIVDNNKIVKAREISVPSAVTSIRSHPSNSSSIFLQLNTGDILEWNYQDSIIPLDISFPVPCPKFDVLSVHNNNIFLGLSHKGCFYINNKSVINNVSSYFIHTNYLLLTTLKHLLVCVELTQAGLDALSSYEENESTGMVYKRKIERGAKLIIAVSNNTRTIFQMPRGNLEAIQPRPLSLKIVGEYLDSLNYNEAFDIMRKERINLNLIYDHNPDLFTANINVFLNSIKNNSWLSLFLADLENVDVTKTMYLSSYTNKKDEVYGTQNTKIQNVCELIRMHINKSADSADRILPLLTTYVKMNSVSDLEQALLLLKKLKMQESSGIKFPVSSDEAMKYLLYMVNVDNLFDVALGMYDFDLVLLVANKSQKDPKEYIHMLNELNEMDENYKQFTINKNLKRFDRAVQCLAKCGESRYSDLRTFVKFHSLYREALSLFSSDNYIYKEISDDFGSYLRLKKQFTEAGLIYERSSNIEKAIECYKEALEWELVFKIAQNKNRDEMNKLVQDIVSLLKNEKRYTEALTVLEQYGDDKKETIVCAIECGKYKTALRLCSQYKETELQDTHILPSLLEEYSKFKYLIDKIRCTFINYKNRLHIVRLNKIKKSEENHDSPYLNRDIDLYSDAGSTIASSSGSGRTFRSSKNRRKHERKMASLKEGSQYEDTALVMVLHSMVTSTFELRLQVREINVALCCINRDKEAAILQGNLESIIKEMKDSFKEIWSNELVLEATNAAIALENVPDGCSVIPQGMASLEPHIRIAPLIQDINWKLDGLH